MSLSDISKESNIFSPCWQWFSKNGGHHIFPSFSIHFKICMCERVFVSISGLGVLCLSAF